MSEFILSSVRIYKTLFFTFFFSILNGQFNSNIVHIDILSESEKVEASIIFDEIIDRDDVSGWIDRDNYFTLSLFNVSIGSTNSINDEYEYPLLSVDAADTDGSVQIVFNTAKKIDSYQLIRHAKDKNLLVILNYSVEQKPKENKGELVKSFIVEELPDTFDVMKDRWRHPKNWKESRERSSIRILCDTKDLPIQRRAELRAELAEPLVEETEAPRVERAGAELRERALLRELLEKLGRLVERLADGRDRPSDGLDLSRRQALRRFDDVLELLGDLNSAALQQRRGLLVEAHLAHREAELG